MEEKTKSYSNLYYEKNKEKINAKLQAKEKCDCCGKMIRHQYLKVHKQTPNCRINNLQSTEKLIETVLRKLDAERKQKNIEV